MLLLNGADVNLACEWPKEKTTPIMAAVLSMSEYLVRRLLDLKANLAVERPDKECPLSLAIGQNSTGILRLLLAYGAEWKTMAKVSEALASGIQNNFRATVGLFLFAAGVDLHDESLQEVEDSLLLWAAANGDTSLVRALLDSKADVNVQTRQGLSALHLACGPVAGSGDTGGTAEMVHLLLRSKANPAVTDKSNRSPLDISLICANDMCRHVMETNMLARRAEQGKKKLDPQVFKIRSGFEERMERHLPDQSSTLGMEIMYMIATAHQDTRVRALDATATGATGSASTTAVIVKRGAQAPSQGHHGVWSMLGGNFSKGANPLEALRAGRLVQTYQPVRLPPGSIGMFASDEQEIADLEAAYEEDVRAMAEAESGSAAAMAPTRTPSRNCPKRRRPQLATGTVEAART
jgi:ankyrin repeat protein